MQPGISMAGRSPRALRHEALLFSCSARLSAPALPCPSLPALVGRTVGCGAASHRRQQRCREKNGDRLTPSPRTLLGLVLQQTSITCLSQRGLRQPRDAWRD